MIRSIGFVVASMVVGFLSGIFAPHVFGVRGAIFGGALAGGVLACDAYRKKKGALPGTVVLAVAVAVSLGTFLLLYGRDAALLYLFNTSFANMAGMSPTTSYSALTCFFISLGVLLCCRTYSFLYFFCIPLLSVLPRAIALEPGMRSGELPVGIPGLSFLCGMFGLLPFLLLWGGAARLFGFLRKKPDNAGDCAVAEEGEI